MSVDLRQCKPGDKLLTKHGTVVEYVGQNETGFGKDYPHRIRYSNGRFGTRTDNGVMCLNSRMPKDEDIVEILK